MVRNSEKNSLRENKESLMMSKAELSRNADISSLSITRIGQKKPCRVEKKRNILFALGLKVSNGDNLFH